VCSYHAVLRVANLGMEFRISNFFVCSNFDLRTLRTLKMEVERIYSVLMYCVPIIDGIELRI